ncbi:MAG: ribosome maturation factor RimM [Rubrivivax sp.]|nr:MAG: ribosome maturation factor RimM [Rubrivivax sp.]
MNDRATASSPQEVLPDGTPWPEDAIEVARIVDAWGIKGGIKLQPFSSDPQALFCTKKWFVRPSDKPAGVARPARGKTPSAPGAATSAVPARLHESRLLKVKNAREQGDLVVATIDGMDNRNDAEALKGARVFVSRSAFPTPDPDEFYWIDLIGLSVVNREGQSLGTVIDLLDTGPHCVLRCKVSGDAAPVAGAAADESSSEPDQVPDAPEHAGERLIPFVAAYIDRVSLAERLIVADWGLDY